MAASQLSSPFETRPAATGTVPGSSLVVLTIGLVMSACLIGLSHDGQYLESNEDVSVERGAGLDEHEKFEKNVNAAPARQKIAFLLLIGVGVYCALTCQRNVTLHAGPVLLLMGGCLVLVVASLLWSVERGETAKEIVRILAYGFVAASVALRLRPREIGLVLATMGLGSVLFACGIEVFTGNFQPWRSGHRLHGSIHSNVLASHAIVTALVAFAFLQSSRRPWLVRTVLLAMLTVIVLTKTRGALATTVVGLGAIYFAGKSVRSGFLVLSVLATFASLAALALVVAGPEVQSRVHHVLLMGRSEGATTLTGRLPLWKELWRESREHRWIGYGYGAFWTIDRMEQLDDELEWYPGHSHSAYLQTMLDIGFLGAALIVALAVACLRRAWRLLRTTNDPAFRFIFGFLVAGFVDGLVEVSFVYPRGLGLFVAMALFSLVTVHAPLRSAARANTKSEELLVAGRDSFDRITGWAGLTGEELED